MSVEEPTPIHDALSAWVLRGLLRVFAEIAVVSALLFYVGRHFGITWLAAGSLVSLLMFGTIAVLGYVWRRFKHWRYPSYYRGEGNG